MEGQCAGEKVEGYDLGESVFVSSSNLSLIKVFCFTRSIY